MTVKTSAKYAVNVALGTGDFVVEKAKELAGNLRQFDPRTFWSERQQQLFSAYDELAKRGETLRKSITRSAPAKRAIDQTKVARTQVKAASTSVKKAFEAGAETAKTAAKKVG